MYLYLAALYWLSLHFTVLCLSTTAFGINSILYQRGIYPPETFTRVTHYDMILQQTTDTKLKNYLTDVVSQLKGRCFWMIICIILILLFS